MKLTITRRKNTLLNAVLADMDEEYLPSGRRKVFSITFCELSGKITRFPYAIKTGLRFNMVEHEMKGVMPCDKSGKPLENFHVIPVWIYAIWEYNNTKL